MSEYKGKERNRKAIRIVVSAILGVALMFSAIPTLSVYVQGGAGEYTADAASRAKKIKVKFNGNSGKASVKSKVVTIGKKYGKLPTASRRGYKLKGWYSKKTGGKKITAKTKVSKKYKTLYARWAGINYKVTFNANGGSVDTGTKTVTFGQAYGALPGGTKPEYELAGWYTAPVGGDKITATTIVSTAANTTLYAHWILKPLVSLYDMDYLNLKGNKIYPKRSMTDNIGIARRGVLFYYLETRTGDYINYLLGSKYVSIKGKIFVTSASKNDTDQAQIKIYRDNVLVKTIGPLTAGVIPIDFEIDLRNAEQLKFEYVRVTGALSLGIDADLKQL